MRPATTPAPEALEYRQTQAEIQQHQTELAVAGVKREEGSRDIIQGIAALEASLEIPDYDREKLIEQTHELMNLAWDHQSEVKNLNRLLAQEREMTRRLGDIFNKREEDWRKALSEREMENAALRVENKGIKGQRNIVLVIAAALGAAWAVYIAYKICKILKVIPI
jgi:hypothetical protein